MSGFIQEFQFYMSYPFVRYALIVGVLISLCSSLLGVTLVLKRFSFIGDGLSHVAFGALAIATVLKIANVNIFIMPVTIVCAILLLRTGTNTKLKGDAAIAMLSVGSMAVGYLILNVFSVTFDENFTRSMGKNTNVYNLMIAVITAVIIVLAMNLVGSLLITALLVFPALSAMRVMTSFKSVIIYSAILSVFGAVFGIIISIFTSTPVGSTIVTIYILIFIINCIIGRILRI